jgi:[phosphatase 2A protein]-leucine-carboxy methyltransferase
VCAQKIHAIDKWPQLKAEVAEERREGSREGSLHSRRYHCIASDATKGRKLTQLLTEECEVSSSEPVLFVFECVLLYWSKDTTEALVATLSRAFTSAAFLVFDVFNTDDRFGHVMQESLSQRDTPLLGVASSQSLDDWRQKFVQNGAKNVTVWDMKTVYEQLLPREDRQRAERLEFLDETELLTQLLSHYCLLFASNYCPVFW